MTQPPVPPVDPSRANEPRDGSTERAHGLPPVAPTPASALPTRHDVIEHNGAPRSTKILSVFLACAVVGAGYLGYLAASWSTYGEQTNAANHELGTDLAHTRAELQSANDSLESTREQLSTAQKRISELAKEKALVGDDREQQRIIAQDTTAVATESLAISRDLGRCLEVQSEYIGKLTKFSNAQSVVNAQLAMVAEDRDDDGLAQAQDKAREAAAALSGMEENLKDVCDGAAKRHNNLVEDLRE